MAALRIPNIVRVSATQNGWMTGAEMAIWQNRTWGPNWDDVRRLLILDQASVHTMNDTKTALANVQTDIIYVPAGCTSISQPADVSWNAPFKNLLRAEWKLWRQIEEGTPRGHLKVASRQDVINWISCTWQGASEGVIVHSFKTTGISSALDGSEDHLLSNNMASGLNAVDRQQHARDEVADLKFFSIWKMMML